MNIAIFILLCLLVGVQCGCLYAFWLILKQAKILNEKFLDGEEAQKELLSNLQIQAENGKLKEKHQEYKRFFTIILDVLLEDSKFIRSFFFAKFANVPEYNDINSQIIQFENKIEGIKTVLKEYRMLEDYED